MAVISTRTLFWAFSAVGVAWAVYAHDLAAAYVAVLFGFSAAMFHALEVKINRLLDAHEITVTQRDIDKE